MQKTKQKKESAGADAGAETVRESHSTATSDPSQTSVSTGAVHGGSAHGAAMAGPGSKPSGRRRHCTYIVLSEQVKGAEKLVVLQIKRPGGLEVAAEGDQVGRLDDELLGCPCLAELLVVLRRREPWPPPRPAAMVVVGVRVEMRCVVEHGGLES